jgi:DNA-binding response OmpR family regulator
MNEKTIGLRVLVVEDEFIIADEIAAIVQAAGHSILGPVASVEEAAAIVAKERPGFAVIDANLRGKSSSPLARQLAESGIPFCVCTGYRPDDLKSTFGDVVLIQKPVSARALAAVLASAAARHTSSRE